nr:hypothetical protein BaRGS_003845 [Batillaria attramentaria]
MVGDRKGISSCLTVLSRCVPRLDHDDYQEIRRRYPDVFQSLHPCYEGYQQGICAVRFVEHIEARFFAAKHQLVADESLLMFTVQQQSPQEQHSLLHTILGEVKRSLAGHRAVQFLNSVEAFVEFVRGVFMAQYLPAFHLQLQNEEGEVFNWVNVEPYLQGSFLKLTNNHRYVSKRGDLEDGVEVATAFTHFSFVETHGRLMVVDLQGWVPSAGKFKNCRITRWALALQEFRFRIEPVQGKLNVFADCLSRSGSDQLVV